MADLLLDQIAEGKPVRIEKDGKTICVARVGEEVFAVADTCTHSDASLSEGDVTGFKIECWLHGASFLRLRNPRSHYGLQRMDPC